MITIWEKHAIAAIVIKIRIPGIKVHYPFTKTIPLATRLTEYARATNPEPRTLFVMFTIEAPMLAFASVSTFSSSKRGSWSSGSSGTMGGDRTSGTCVGSSVGAIT